MREFIAEVNREHGTTVALTTHDLSDVQRLCSRVILIDHGWVLYDGTVAELKSRNAPYRTLVLRLADGSGRLQLDPADVVGLGAEVVPAAAGADDDGAVRLRLEGERTAASDLIAGLAARYPIADLSIVEPELEGVVHQIYSRRGLPT